MATDYVFDIVLMNGPPWGFTMAGGKDFQSPLQIAQVLSGGQAEDEQILVGDHILEINGSDTMALTQAEAEKEISLAGQTLMLTLARDMAGGNQPRVQYEMKAHREYRPPVQEDPETDPDRIALPGLAAAATRLSLSPSREDGSEEGDGIIQGRTFKLLQKATESPDGPSWPSKFAGETTSSPVAGAGHLRKAVIQMKPIGTEQTTILMSSPTESKLPPVTKLETPTESTVPPKAKAPPARRTSEVEIICKSPTSSQGVGSFTVATKAKGPPTSPPAVTTTTTTTTVTVVRSTASVVSTHAPSGSSTSSPAKGESGSGNLRRTSRNTSVSEEASPWLGGKQENVEKSPSPQIDDDDDDDDDDDIQAIRQSRTFRKLAQATKKK